MGLSTVDDIPALGRGHQQRKRRNTIAAREGHADVLHALREKIDGEHRGKVLPYALTIGLNDDKPIYAILSGTNAPSERVLEDLGFVKKTIYRRT